MGISELKGELLLRLAIKIMWSQVSILLFLILFPATDNGGALRYASHI